MFVMPGPLGRCPKGPGMTKGLFRTVRTASIDILLHGMTRTNRSRQRALDSRRSQPHRHNKVGIPSEQIRHELPETTRPRVQQRLANA